MWSDFGRGGGGGGGVSRALYRLMRVMGPPQRNAYSRACIQYYVQFQGHTDPQKPIPKLLGIDLLTGL